MWKNLKTTYKILFQKEKGDVREMLLLDLFLNCKI